MTEKNETPAEHPAETTAPAPGEVKMRKSWHGCLSAFFVVVFMLSQHLLG